VARADQPQGVIEASTALHAAKHPKEVTAPLEHGGFDPRTTVDERASDEARLTVRGDELQCEGIGKVGASGAALLGVCEKLCRERGRACEIDDEPVALARGRDASGHDQGRPGRVENVVRAEEVIVDFELGAVRELARDLVAALLVATVARLEVSIVAGLAMLSRPVAACRAIDLERARQPLLTVRVDPDDVGAGGRGLEGEVLVGARIAEVDGLVSMQTRRSQVPRM
jgi:hypothetical protein